MPVMNSSAVAKDYDSDGDGEPDRQELFYAGPYRRQGAMDKYNRDYAEFVIQQKLEARLTRVEDAVEMFYYRIERIVDDDDQDYNELSKNFGFKTQIMRYLNLPSHHFEVFEPCLIRSTQRRIDIVDLNSLKFKERKLPLMQDQERRSTLL